MSQKTSSAGLFTNIRKYISIEELCRAVGENADRIETLFNQIETLLEKSDALEADHVVINIDGAARGNPGPAGIGVVIVDSRGVQLAELGTFIGEATNNMAEYRALQLGLQKASELSARSVLVRTDSELLVKQVQGTYRIKKGNLIPLFKHSKELISLFDSFSIEHIHRKANKRADILANNAIDAALAGQT